MRRLTAVLLSLFLMLSASACAGKANLASMVDVPEAPEFKEAGEDGLVWEENALCSPEGAREMLRACGQLAAYLATSVYEIDSTQPEPEDFWLILSLVTYGARADAVGEFGTIDLTKAQVEDIARTFFPELMESAGLPSTDEAYSAEYVAAEGLYELQPMQIGDMEFAMGSVAPGPGGEHCEIAIHLTDSLARTEKLDWIVTLSPWEDPEDHFFPCRFEGIRIAEDPAE